MSRLPSGARAFTVAVGVVLLVLLALVLDLSRAARAVPLALLAVALPIWALQMALELRPHLRARLPWAGPHRLFRVEAYRAGSGETVTGRAAAGVLAWLAAFPALAVILGLPAAMFAHALIYLRLIAREGWMVSVSVAAVLGGLALATARMYGG